ncbi:splicing factor U2af large subunit B-like [Prunus avium]|uniref:Splicing factor U2af large subunit B-like n=1 Tax=Prunus avium TaxID=42229 RepID=A0A6P5RW30_PRUAV|nr:splicing factor U2af large subunit B-like [Prunus avium]
MAMGVPLPDFMLPTMVVPTIAVIPNHSMALVTIAREVSGGEEDDVDDDHYRVRGSDRRRDYDRDREDRHRRKSRSRLRGRSEHKSRLSSHSRSRSKRPVDDSKEAKISSAEVPCQFMRSDGGFPESNTPTWYNQIKGRVHKAYKAGSITGLC